jgi:dihydrodipicolinate synthase/N-acetylneuraminate lyase
MEAGAVGVVSVASQVLGTSMRQLVDMAAAGQMEGARQLDLK